MQSPTFFTPAKSLTVLDSRLQEKSHSPSTEHGHNTAAIQITEVVKTNEQVPLTDGPDCEDHNSH